jgi:hypothetical protein
MTATYTFDVFASLDVCHLAASPSTVEERIRRREIGSSTESLAARGRQLCRDSAEHGLRRHRARNRRQDASRAGDGTAGGTWLDRLTNVRNDACGGELIIVTGPPGAGKSTVSGLVADGFPFSVLIRADWFFSLRHCRAIDHWLAQARPQTTEASAAAVAATGAFVRMAVDAHPL